MTMKSINAVLNAAGLDVEFFKGDGYFYFVAGDNAPSNFTSIPSIYQNNMFGLTPEYILRYVREEIGLSDPAREAAEARWQHHADNDTLDLY